MALSPGTRLGAYEILSALGAGGMGEVYLARDPRLRRDVAIKTLPAAVANDTARRARFEREAQTISQLSHPNICAIYDIGNADGVAYLVMEYIEGRSVADHLRLGPIPWSRALPWAIEIASAIDAAHRRGIVHRDLKPANIMIGDSGVKLLDFGIAKLLEPSEQDSLAVTATLTSEHQIVGTLHYMAPEQLEGRPVDARTDIFAFGATLYEMLTARHAFDGTTRASVTAAVLTAEPQPMCSSAANDLKLPPGLEHVVRRALAKNPADRWQTARDLMMELKAVLERASREPSADAWPEPAGRPAARRSIRRSPRTIAIAASLMITAGAASWYATGSRPITLAVVPLEAATGAQTTDALDDGITEDIINKLGQARPTRLKVIAHSSVLRYKGVKFDAPSAAKELGAGMILTLRITPQAGAVAIGLELIRGDDGTSVWRHKSTSSLEKLFGNEEDIAIRTLEQLQIELSDEERRLVSKRYTENFDAYLEYASGWSLMDRQANTDANYREGLEFFKRAIKIDPNYARAHIGVAAIYTGLGFEGFMPPGEALIRTREAVAKANELDAATVEASAHPSILEMFQWNFDRTEVKSRRAIALNPDDPTVHKFWARQLRAMGRWPEAIAAGRRTLKLDPMGVQSNTELATSYAWQGDLTAAIKQYRRTLEIDPHAGPVHELLADTYARVGNYEQAIAEMREALNLAGGPGPTIADALGADFVTSGYDAAMRNLYFGQLNACIEASKAGEYVSPVAFAQIYSRLGEKDKAFASLEQAFQERHPWLAFLKSDLSFEPLRTDPRFADLVRRIGIPTQSWLRERWLQLLSRLGLL